MSVFVRNKVVSFEPYFTKFRDLLLEPITMMINLIKKFNRIEYTLYPEFYNEKSTTTHFLKPIILDEIVEPMNHKIVELVKEQRIGPELTVIDFDEFRDIINDNVPT